jgi:diadenosine tetraphosphatase ApaH/serine/threonine PP2A family protein phosphatase
MRTAVFADIHGNLEALETAREYAEKHRLSRFWVLGDSIGYGVNPNECLSWALQNAELHVLGNHEAAILHEEHRERFTDWARVAIDWTAERLRPELVAGVKALPYLQTAGGVTLAHGTLHSPEEFHYLLDESDAYKSFLALRTSLGFVGHSHVPCFFSEKEGTGGYLKEGILKLGKKERYLLNPGSIGQSRDRDPRLSFGILDEDELTFEIVRLAYDNKKASEKILAAGLPRSLAYRLL